MFGEHFFLRNGWTGITTLSFKNVQSAVEPFPVRFQSPNIWAEISVRGQYRCGSQRLSTAVMNLAGAQLLLVWTLLHSKACKVTSRSTVLNQRPLFFFVFAQQHFQSETNVVGRLKSHLNENLVLILPWILFICSKRSRKWDWKLHHARYAMQHTVHTLHLAALRVTKIV